MKKVLAVLLVAAAIFCCTACGLDMSKVKGDWTLDTAGGKTVEELAEMNGVNPAYLDERYGNRQLIHADSFYGHHFLLHSG